MGCAGTRSSSCLARTGAVSWAARFQANTLKIMTVPLLLGNVLNLMMWAGAKLDMVEIETLFALKKAKERRLFGVVVEEEEEDPGHAVEATLRQIDRAHEQGEYTSEQAEELESLLLQTRAEKELFDTQIVDLKAKIERQQGERRGEESSQQRASERHRAISSRDARHAAAEVSV